LSPAKVTSIELNEDDGRADVYLKPDQVSLAIGKGGFNIRLAGKLTGYELDVYREGAEDIDDVDLSEFKDEIEGWIIKELNSIGLDSAKSVIEMDMDDLVKRTDLEIETVEDVVNILKAEFEQEEGK
jgi:N utilization substance protein A